MLSHLFESTKISILTQSITFCYSTFLAMKRWRKRSFSIVSVDRPLQLFLNQGRALFLHRAGRSAAIESSGRSPCKID